MWDMPEFNLPQKCNRLQRKKTQQKIMYRSVITGHIIYVYFWANKTCFLIIVSNVGLLYHFIISATTTTICCRAKRFTNPHSKPLGRSDLPFVYECTSTKCYGFWHQFDTSSAQYYLSFSFIHTIVTCNETLNWIYIKI